MKEKSAIGCTKDCDKQLISLDHLDICMGIIQKKIAELEKLLQDQRDVREASEQSTEPTSGISGKKTKEQLEESMQKIQQKVKLLTIDKLSDEKVKKAEEQLAAMQEFKEKTAPEIGR